MFCRAPFLGLSVSPDKKCCCCMNIEDISIEQHRIDMYKGKIHNVCKDCRLRFDFENIQYDDVFNKNLKNFNINNGTINDFYPAWLHIIYSYKCNCGCKICGTWMYENDNKIPIKEIDKYINKKYLKYITIQGGEIFIFYNELKKILSGISNLPIRIHIITNGTIINNSIIDIFKQYKDIELTVSLDGCDDKEKYMRPNSNYNLILNNIKEIKKYVKRININYTVSIFNIYETIENLLKLKNDIGEFEINVNMVVQPYCYSILSLPRNIKNDILNMIDINYIINSEKHNYINNILKLLKTYPKKNILNDIILFLKKENVKFDKNKLYESVIKNDKKYNLNIDILHPKIKEYILSCKKAT